MQKRTLAIGLILVALALVGACKKNNKPAGNPNVPHALTDSFYYRAMFDTTWVYHGDGHRDECESNNALCSSFLYDATFTLIDSNCPNPHDSVIRSWAQKTFVTNSDTSTPHRYIFKFTCPDSLGRPLSTEFTPNSGSLIYISSVTPNGVSTYTLDTAGHGYPMYTVKGQFHCNVSRYQDTSVVKISNGEFSINVMSSTHP